jgi:hypothetical protein
MEGTRPEAAPAPTRPFWRRRGPWHVLVLLLATAAHWLPRLEGPIDLSYDAGVYFILGTSLAHGDGYRLLNEPGEIRAVQYPPLLPAIVALHELALGSDDPLLVGRALRWSSFALSLLYAVGAYALARRWLGAWPALLSGLLTTLYFQTFYLEDLCFSEIPFAATTLGFFLSATARSPGARRLAPPLAAAAFFLRTAGVALLAAWAAAALLRRDWRAFLGRALLGALCVGAWQGYVWRVSSSAEYQHPAYEYQRAPYQYYNVSYRENLALVDPFSPEQGRSTPALLARRAVTNVPSLVLGVGQSVSTARGFYEWPLRALARKLGRWVPLRPVLAPIACLGAAALAGVYLLARRGATLVALYVGFSLGLIAILPWPAQIPRYLAPLVPFLTAGLACALASAARRPRLRVAAAGAGALLVALQAVSAVKVFDIYRHPVRYPGAQGESNALFLFDDAAAWQAFYGALGWLREHAESGAVVATSCPHLVYLHAQRKAVLPPFEGDPAEALRLIEAVPADYAIVDGLSFLNVSRRYAEPAVGSAPERWEAVYRDAAGSLAIYRRVR